MVSQRRKIVRKEPSQDASRSTYIAFYREFRKVVDAHIKSTQNYELTIGDKTYFCKCIMQPYNDMVLCQYRDITARSQQKLELERRNRELCEIQKVALIGRWSYSTETHFLIIPGILILYMMMKNNRSL